MFAKIRVVLKKKIKNSQISGIALAADLALALAISRREILIYAGI